MPETLCRSCGSLKSIDGKVIQTRNRQGDIEIRSDTIRGAIICCECGESNPFELRQNAFTFLPGSKQWGTVNEAVPLPVRSYLFEAEMSLYAGCLLASAAMCRAAVEEALEAALKAGGFTVPRGLRDRITEAKTAGLLSDREFSLAFGSKLFGDDAVHGAPTLQFGEVPSLLTATIQVVNHLFP